MITLGNGTLLSFTVTKNNEEFCYYPDNMWVFGKVIGFIEKRYSIPTTGQARLLAEDCPELCTFITEKYLDEMAILAQEELQGDIEKKFIEYQEEYADYLSKGNSGKWEMN